MGELSIGKIRGLQQIANSDGIFVMCAMDHRGSLRKMLDEEHPRTVSYRTMVNHKLDLCRTLAPQASGVLLDPVYGVSQAIAAGVLPGATGLLVSMEATGYASSQGKRITELLPNWNVEKAKRLGASAVKLLLYHRPDLEEIASKQLATVQKLAEECLKADIPLLVEPKSYAVGKAEREPREFAKIKPELVIETARQITALPIDVLKAEFPADLEFEENPKRLLDLCRELDASSRVPWVILSAGVDFEVFHKQVKIACQAGASGFLGGRALWQEATGISSRIERLRFLEATGVERLRHLALIANTYGRPWFEKLGMKKYALAPVDETWHQRY